MRILTAGNMYPPHHLGGYELTWRSSVRQLRSTGHEVRVLTTDFRRPDPDPAIPEDPDAHRELRWYWRDHDFPRTSVRERVGLERHNAALLERHLAEFRPDVVCWWAMGGMSLGLLEQVRRRGVPAVGVVGDDWMLYGPKVDAWMSLTRRGAPLASLAERLAGVPAKLDLSGTVWLFNSEATLARALEAGLRLDRAEVAHPGVDTELFRPAPAATWSWRLAYLGRIDERKGIDTAVRALVHLPEDARLDVMGTGDERHARDLRELAERLGLEGRVRFGSSPRDEVPKVYAAADVLVFPVRWDEPWGLVPLEAMAVGTPVVTTGTGGSAEYLEDGKNALVVGREAGPAELAAAVRRLADEPTVRARLVEGGRATAARYTEERYNEAIADALARVSRERGRA